MGTQTTLDDFLIEHVSVEMPKKADFESVSKKIGKVKTENGLTPRQWKLYDFLKYTTGIRFTQEKMILAYENWLLAEGFLNGALSYNYFEEKRVGKHFSDMTSARQMRTDLRALRNEPVIQKVIVQGKIANTEAEALDCLAKRKAKALKELKLYWTEVKKLEKNQQRRLVFGQERDYIEALLEEKGE